ncbi:hypothetical protein [Legionella taurinensis]|uniref:hypothetical protein n=1 Tax=Legionella taurinensis TaxID=70611 RepID=UPI000E1B6876|nr:hypothetical protein [Legionella taurinensis]
MIPRFKRFTVVGVFSAGPDLIRYQLAFINLGDAQKLLQLGDQVSGVKMKSRKFIRHRNYLMNQQDAG